jgi:hypothetical protein
MSIKQDLYSSFLGEEITGDLEVKVWSTSIGDVVYALDDPRVHRNWKPGELKIITFHELYQLANTPGGMPILVNHLQIRDENVRKALQLPMEPEYFYTEEDARKLVNTGTEEEILDALEFGPRSLASMIRYFAILDIDSLEKMKFFNGLFRMNIQQIRENLKEDDEEVVSTTESKRRVQKAPEIEAEPVKETKKTRKASTLTPSEPTQQVPTEE